MARERYIFVLTDENGNILESSTDVASKVTQAATVAPKRSTKVNQVNKDQKENILPKEDKSDILGGVAEVAGSVGGALLGPIMAGVGTAVAGPVGGAVAAGTTSVITSLFK
jgi:hypothetical protein